MQDLTIAQEELALDLLDRQEFVDQLMRISTILSDNKKNACYAINGDWGVGKSFVLDMFEKQAESLGREGELLSRFLIFHYNCWEYDYYEEPLVAIVASMLDQINEQVNLLPEEIKERIVATLKIIGKGLAKKAFQFIEEETGVDLEEAVDVLKEGNKAANKEMKKSHEYDHYFAFKKNLKNLRETIETLSEDQTVLIIVDELDRCLPEYTIKVLERLHHLFSEIPNVQVIISIDIGQIEHAVHQIYGEKTDAKKYMRKFIQFEFTLDEGIIGDNFDSRFRQYTNHFVIQTATTSAIDVVEFKSYILKDLDMRSRISIIDRAEMIHSILSNDDVLDSSYMCLEMLLVILNDYKLDTDYANKHFSIENVFIPSHLQKENARAVPSGLSYLSTKYKENQDRGNDEELYKKVPIQTMNYRPSSITYIRTSCLLGKLLGAYRYILGFRDDQYLGNDENSKQKALNQYANNFWNTLQIIH